jgi:hypothetical protein
VEDHVEFEEERVYIVAHRRCRAVSRGLVPVAADGTVANLIIAAPPTRWKQCQNGFNE